ncbi:Helix-turn-helix [Weeksella virosa]|uniref:helix-turn-helix domain-containing protein n=1 Tax=Weeksella virosa TaxID=1014 RepID=UPI000F7080CE|nr:helix-turn-helix transcriptional regulator [Weeksella virosa]VEH63280.1 Helix-turn-helix [Weeksella virosa]
MKLRVKEVARNKGIDLQTLSKKLGITYQALNARIIGNPSLKVLQEIADALDCPVFELLPPGNHYQHYYDEKGNYNGILKKTSYNIV